MLNTYPRLKPIVEFDNVWVLHLLQHFQFVIDHLLIAADILLQDDLDSDLAIRAVGLANDAIGSSTQGLSKLVA